MFGGAVMPIWPFMRGNPVRESDGVGTAEGIRTMGRLVSMPGTPMRDMTDSAGDLKPSLIVDPPMDDFLLIAMLGV